MTPNKKIVDGLAKFGIGETDIRYDYDRESNIWAVTLTAVRDGHRATSRLRMRGKVSSDEELGYIHDKLVSKLIKEMNKTK